MLSFFSMKRHKERKFWFSMFLSYTLITFLCFLMYIIAVFISSYELDRQKYDLKNERILNSSQAFIEEKTNAVMEAVSNINNSTAFRPLYLSLVEGREMNTVDRVYMQMGLKSIYARYVAKGLDDLVVFTDDSDFAFSGSGLVYLNEPFEHMSFPTIYVSRESISSLMDVDDEKYSFSRENLIFASGFRYEGGVERGVIVLSFDASNLIRALSGITQGRGFRLNFKNQTLYSHSFDESADIKAVRDKNIPALELELSFPEYTIAYFDFEPGVILSLLIGFAVFVVMLFLSFRFSLRYYKPLKTIRNIVPVSGKVGGDEIEAMIGELEGMVVEYGEYKSNLSDIAPYVEKGLFHGYVVDRKNDQNNFAIKHFGFAKPYYFVIAVRFDCLDYQAVEEALNRMRQVFSKDEVKVTFYRRDYSNAFISINMDSDEDIVPLVEGIYNFLVGALDEKDKVTFGVDRMRTDLSDLTNACNSALSALELMLVQGKGDIYYAEDSDTSEVGYYLPQSLEISLMNYIREGRAEEGEVILKDLLNTNLMKYDLSAKAVRLLADELYYSILKTARGLSLAIDAPKADPDSTIEEVFAYYGNLYRRLAEVYKEQTDKEKEEYAPLISFVDENYTLPELSQKYLCEKFHVSAKTITNCFFRQFGITYLKYVTSKRIEKSKNLLVNTSESIDSIALLCGYTSTLSFRRNFKEEVGLTPSEYRLKSSV